LFQREHAAKTIQRSYRAYRDSKHDNYDDQPSDEQEDDEHAQVVSAAFTAHAHRHTRLRQLAAGGAHEDAHTVNGHDTDDDVRQCSAYLGHA
jgi:hypothetical protein